MSPQGPTLAALYDVHGNLPALEAVLAEVAALGVDEVVVGGDVVPGPFPAECLEALAALDVPVRTLAGNGEHDVLAVRRGETPARVPARFHGVLRWVAEALPAGLVDELAGWPAAVEATVPGVGEVLFCHATPRDDNEIFTRVTPEERLRPVFDGVDADVVVCGHTHMPFDRTVGGVRVVNAGSVGMPFGHTGASWLLLGPDVELRRTDYDLDAAVERIAASGYPAAEHVDVRRPPPEERMLEVFETSAVGADGGSA